jgi:hypothetical protein
MILGYEPRRALAVFREVGATRTIAIIPSPPSEPAGDLKCRLLNSRILRDQSVIQLSASEDDPEDLASKLRDLGTQYPDAGFCIAPLGSKFQAVGVFNALLGT